MKTIKEVGSYQQVDHVAVTVAKNLHLDVTGRPQVPLDENHTVAKRRDRLTRRRHERVSKALGVMTAGCCGVRVLGASLRW